MNAPAKNLNLPYAKAANQRESAWLITWMLLLALAIGNWALNQPRFVTAESGNSRGLAQILEQAHEELALERYELAGEFFEQALEIADQDQHEQISDQLERCVAWAAVETRYDDASFLSSIEQSDAETANDFLNTTISMIQERYYVACDWRELLLNALWQLQAAAEQHENHQLLTEAIDTQRQLVSQATDVTLDDAHVVIRELIPAAEQAGHGQSWLAIQMAYGLADSLDEYSHLLSPQRFQAFYNQLSGAYVGVGVDIIIQNGRAVVFDVVPYSPAAQVGLEPGDIISAVGETALDDNVTAGQLGQLLRGVRGSRVDVTLQRGESEIRRRLTRQIVAAPSVRQQQIIAGTDIGYLRLATFDNDTAMELRRAVNMLQVSGAERLIVDLRNNGGGMMNSAVDTAAMFMDRGLLLTVQTAGQERRFRAESNSYPSYDMPVVLLVNNHTASAAEILTSALKDNGRAVVIGQQTLGKGIVQTVLAVPNSRTGMTLTTARYLSPNGVCFHRVGIEPDIEVAYPDNSSVISARSLAQVDDPAIRAAIGVN